MTFSDLWKLIVAVNIQKLGVILVIIASSTCCFSQNADSVFVGTKSSNIKLAYISSIIYPGASIGIELPLNSSYLTKAGKSGPDKRFTKERFLTVGLSGYHHPAFHDNIYFTAGWTARRTRSNGLLTEFSPEAGLSRTFLGGTTYQVDNSGNVTREKLAGYYYALISVGGGIGYDFSKTKQKPFILFSKLNVLMLFPYNSTIYFRPLIEMGMIFKPLNFMSFRVKSKIVNK